jgi:hypothetical protein
VEKESAYDAGSHTTHEDLENAFDTRPAQVAKHNSINWLQQKTSPLMD